MKCLRKRSGMEVSWNFTRLLTASLFVVYYLTNPHDLSVQLSNINYVTFWSNFGEVLASELGHV